MIELDLVHQELARQPSYVSTVELAIMLEANVSEVRQRLNELGDRVSRNEHDEWRVVGDLVCETEQLPLTKAELQERDELENTVQQAFFVAGQALKILRDKRLYRESHNRFEDYLRDRFDFTKRKAYYLIDAYDVVENLKVAPSLEPCKGAGSLLKSEQFVHFLPTSESQCRPIAKLPPEQQREVWHQAVEKANGKVPSARIIKQVIQELRGEEPSKMFNQKKDGPVQVPGIGNEYIAVLNEQTYWRLKKYQEKIGVATFNGAIRRLLDEEQKNNSSN